MRKIMSILLTLTLILGPPPVTVAAEGGSETEVWVGGTNVASGDNITYWLNGSDGGIDSTDAVEENYNVKFDPNEGKPTLTLREASIMKSYTVPSGVFTGSQYGIYSNVELKLVIVGDNNRIISEDVSGKSSAGIYVYPGNLTISGSGTLTVYGGKGSFSYGIFIGSGDLTVESGNLVVGGENDATQKSCGIELQGNGHLAIKNGGNVTASGGKTAYPSYGVISTNPTGKIIVESGGKLLAKGGNSTSSSSYGIHSTSLDINGELTAIGASAGTYSYGIRGNNIIISSDAVVNAVGSIATNKSYGILVGNNPGNKISINGGEVIVYAQSHAMDMAPDVSGFGNLQATASENYTGTPTIQYKSDSIGNYKYLKFGPDNTSPTVASVSVPVNGTYLSGNNLDFTVNFSENVIVTGMPCILLTIGSNSRNAMYTSGNGTTALVFRYTVQADDSDSDGITVGSLTLNGGTIQDIAGNNATLALHNIGSTSDVLMNPPAPSYTATFNPNSGAVTETLRSVASGTAVGALPTPTHSGSYSFAGWYTAANGGTQISESTIVSADVIYYAQWTYTGGGSGGGSGSGGATSHKYEAEVASGGNSDKTDMTVDARKGSASVELSAEDLKNGTDFIVTMPNISGVTDYDLGLPVARLASDSANSTISLSTAAGSVTLPSNMLTGTEEASGNTACITIGTANSSTLTDSARAAVGDRPVVTLSLSIDGKPADWNNPGAPVTVSIPYAVAEGEDQNAIVIWYIDGTGNLNCVTNGCYDPKTGTVTFQTTHFSLYAVGYNQVTFADVAASAWHHSAVAYLAARGITSGSTDTTFSPDATLTRGQFITMLLRAYGIEADVKGFDNFVDAGNTYYTGYLAMVRRLGISDGVGGNRFAPEQAITRQEMFTLLYNALKVLGELPGGDSGKTLADFADSGSVASWAKEAMNALVKTGIVFGSGGKLAPAYGSTRAEMAQVLYNLLNR